MDIYIEDSTLFCHVVDEILAFERHIEGKYSYSLWTTPNNRNRWPRCIYTLLPYINQWIQVGQCDISIFYKSLLMFLLYRSICSFPWIDFMLLWTNLPMHGILLMLMSWRVMICLQFWLVHDAYEILESFFTFIALITRLYNREVRNRTNYNVRIQFILLRQSCVLFKRGMGNAGLKRFYQLFYLFAVHIFLVDSN